MIHDLSSLADASKKLGLGTVFAVQTVVVLLPLNGADDLLRLEGCAEPGDYFFSHATKAPGEVQPSAARWACFTLPHPPVSGHSSGLSFSINSPLYRRDAPAGYRFESMSSSATGRMFQ